MKKAFYILILISFDLQIFGQTNLVLNPSLEVYSSCPGNGNEVYKATSWDSYRGSPDYFNSCATVTDVTTPNNFFGYQFPFQGNAYGGFYTYDSNGQYREIIGVQLSSPLVVNQKYFFSCHINRAYADLIITYATNNIGIKLSKVIQQNVAIDNTTKFNYANVITDTLSWTKIFGSFISDSTYQHLMIGNFYDDVSTTTVNTGNGAIAYYFIDDVCLSTDSIFTSEYTTNIKNHNNDRNEISVFPNPTSDMLIIQTKAPSQIKLLNKFGQCILTKDIRDSETLDLSNILIGLYFLQVKSDNQVYYEKIIIKR